MAVQDSMLERLPPHDSDAEEAVLGSVLIDPDTLVRVSTIVEPADFFRDRNRTVYEALLALSDRATAVNLVTVARELDDQGHLDAVGGMPYLTSITAGTPTSLHAEFYAEIVRRTSLQRRLIQAAAGVAALGYEAGPDVDGAIAKAEELIVEVRQGKKSREFVHVRDILDTYFEESMQPPADGEVGQAIESGFIDLDRLLGGGLKRSDLIILAARPGMGKTSLAMNMALNSARRSNATVGIFSLEMSKEQLVSRLLSGEAGVDSARLRLDLMSEDEQDRVMESAGLLSELALYVDDTPMINISQMKSRARRLASERPIDFIIIDYLQLIQGNGTDNRVQEVSEISRSLKGLARELNVPVLALSQLSRAVESRSPHIPMLSDLRESGSIEQDADIVMFIYREDVYYTDKEWERKFPTKPFPKGIADLIIAKHRNGPTGQVSLLFFEKQTKFVNLSASKEI